MDSYRAPVDDIAFLMQAIGDQSSIAALPGYEEATADTIRAVLDEAARFGGEVLAPLNMSGDAEGCHLAGDVVTLPAGFADAYRQFIAAGWTSVAFDPEFGGQGMPWLLTTALQEVWNAANLSFSLCPLLSQGAIELLQTHGSDVQKALYLPPMIAGSWTGTMNLTEPQAGTDLGAVRCRAEPDGDRHKITGQKIFITWGEHDAAENIVHLVLARLPDAPAGSKGISLFIVPKFLPGTDGKIGARNDLRCLRLEHKLGIHGSPTCEMSYDGATEFLVGAPNRGLELMFTMMNNARLAVGVQGLAISERAYQRALAYAGDRVQMKPAAPAPGSEPAAGPLPIVHHPDVARMLVTMRVSIAAMRALILYTAAMLDRAKKTADDGQRAQAQQRLDLLIPIAKAWCTDRAQQVVSLALQVHGGAGFIEETGAAQYLRDARITPIYEGTNGIQAIDLYGRKLLRDKGAAYRALSAEIRASASPALTTAIDRLDASAKQMLELGARNEPRAGLALATPFQAQFGTTLCAWLLERAAKDASGAWPAIADGFAALILPETLALAAEIDGAGRSVSEWPIAYF